MAPRGAAPTLPVALALAAVAVGAWAQGLPGSLSPGQGCAALGRCCPGRDPNCAARGSPRCFCDQACGAARDCCADYARVCPAVPCVVAEWSDWSRCAKPCQVSYRVRQRHILQEPRNGGAPCPPLEEQAGCMEYWSRQGVECQQSLRELGVATSGCQWEQSGWTVGAPMIPGRGLSLGWDFAFLCPVSPPHLVDELRSSDFLWAFQCPLSTHFSV
ncbi:somatomedin-B and thrombospondin type-1 domain-containing protein-like [Loxodonta africana]|uniref:somatomedin-B and thrombospondin type-1 domain-containing protein-like n=1 Tax=Loxodonta africana TaxID=9785 RepID=UPI0030CB4398